jgi:antirestriction protein
MSIVSNKLKYGIYFANLAEYVSGRRVGDWVYPLAYADFEAFNNAIKTATKDADEVAVHDYDNFLNMGEYPDHESIYNLAHALDGSSLDDDILIQYFEGNFSNDFEELPDVINQLEDAYVGEYDSLKDFAVEIADEVIMSIVNEEAQQFIFRYFDYESYASDLKHDYHIIYTYDGKVAIFNNL